MSEAEDVIAEPGSEFLPASLGNQVKFVNGAKEIRANLKNVFDKSRLIFTPGGTSEGRRQEATAEEKKAFIVYVWF